MKNSKVLITWIDGTESACIMRLDGSQFMRVYNRTNSTRKALKAQISDGIISYDEAMRVWEEKISKPINYLLNSYLGGTIPPHLVGQVREVKSFSKCFTFNNQLNHLLALPCH